MASWKNSWPVISPLLDRILDLPAVERPGFLAEIARERADLAKVLGELVDEHERLLGSRFLESPLPNAAVISAEAGQTVGAYTLDIPLGAGGMGTVWRARRSDGRFEGYVAVKLLNLAMRASGGDERFKREGTVLARLAHPNIARLLDAGVTAAGQPYLVLEYVEGRRIDEFADEHRLDVDRRLELFAQVAQAVAYAHTCLIVHRDLKPSNIMVGSDGRITLLDFGIAKLLEPSAAGAPDEITLPGAHALTPEYAAPEQAAGGTITTATDVYALGVLLYRLLTGRHPTGETCRTPVEYLDALLRNEPMRPSDAVVAPSAQAADRIACAALRSATPERLQRLYRGDIDTILAAALRKQPAERYATVDALARDLRRFVNREPISVKPSSWRYRAGKFVSRHRAGVAVSVGVAASLLAATALSIYLAIEARRQRDEAQFQSRRAEASSEFMRSLVTQIGSTPMTMKQVLDRGRAALEQQYAGDPAFVARMLLALSGPYIELGEGATAAEMTDRALAIGTKLDDAGLLASAQCGAAEDAVFRGDAAAAHAHLSAGLLQLKRQRSEKSECGVAATELALQERRYNDAITEATNVVASLKTAGNTRSTRYTSSMDNLALAYGYAGRFRESAFWQHQVTEVSKQIGRGRTIGVVVSLSNEANANWMLGRWLAAERAVIEAIDIAKGRDPSGGIPFYVALSYGKTLVALGRTAEGMSFLADTIADSKSPARFVDIARMTMTTALLDRSDVVGARASLDRIDPNRLSTANDRALIAVLQARLAMAEGRPLEARKTLADALRADGYPTASTGAAAYQLLDYASRFALDAGEREQAIAFARDEVRFCDRDMGTDQPSANTGRAHLRLGLALAESGRTADARAELERAETLIAQAAGPDHAWTRDARSALQRVSPAPR